MEDTNLEVLVDVEVVSVVVVLLKNILSFGNFLILSSCSFAFFRLAYPLSKERFSVCLSCELKQEF
jgi:hypothetical protein